MPHSQRFGIEEERTVRGWIFNIQRFCSDDGPGIRTTVFLKGCPLRCDWCHNPESQSLLPQVSYDAGRCIRCDLCFEACPERAISPQSPLPPSVCKPCGICADVCPTGARGIVGREVSSDELFKEAARDQEFFEESRGGVTLSGGEPLSQPAFLISLLENLAQAGIHTAVDTSGYSSWNVLRSVAERTNLILFDLKGMSDERHRHRTGVSNRRILDNLQRLSEMGAELWIRIPLIPGHNDDDPEVEALSNFLSSLPRRHPVWLLPYHRLGQHKRSLIGLDPAPGFDPPAKESLEQVSQRLRDRGFEVFVKQ